MNKIIILSLLSSIILSFGFSFAKNKYSNNSDTLIIKGQLTNSNKCKFVNNQDELICDQKTYYKRTTKSVQYKEKNKNNEIKEKTLLNDNIYIY